MWHIIPPEACSRNYYPSDAHQAIKCPVQIDAEILLKQLQQNRRRWGAVEPVPDKHLDVSRPEATGAIFI